jgi:hypothetical protein
LRVKVNSVTGTGTVSYVVNGSNGIQGIGAVVSATFTPSGTQDVNVVKYGGTSTTLGQKTEAASIPVVLPSDQSTINVDLTSFVVGQNTMANSFPIVIASNQSAVPVSGTVTVSQSDPCASGNAKTVVPIGITANTKILTGVSAKKWYVCSINLVVGAATNVALVEGTGSTCGSSTAGMAGGATAATGWNFAANGGLTQGSGTGTLTVTATAADDVCIFVSAANQTSGFVSAVNQ